MTLGPNKSIDHQTDFTIAIVWQTIKRWKEQDTYPWIKQKAVDYIAPRAALFISLTALFSHAIWAIHSKCGVNFQRSGSIIVLSAAALLAIVDWHDPQTGLLSGKMIEPIKLLDPYVILPILGIVGTAVWGYGDLLPFFGNCGFETAACKN